MIRWFLVLTSLCLLVLACGKVSPQHDAGVTADATNEDAQVTTPGAGASASGVLNGAQRMTGGGYTLEASVGQWTNK